MTHNTGQRCDTCAPAHRKQHNDARAYYHTPAWRRVRNHVVDRDYGQCTVCASSRLLAVHHVLARKDGGADTPDNLVTLCTSCHSKLEAGVPGLREAVDTYLSVTTA